MPAAQNLAPPPVDSVALSAAEVAERLGLRDQLRQRHSLDHIARGWYGGLTALILTALFGHNLQGSGRAVVIGLGIAAGFAWGYALTHVVRAVRLARTEGIKVRRMEELDARAPKAPELF